MLALAITFEGTITLGSVIAGGIIALLGIAAAIYGTRYKISYEAALSHAKVLQARVDFLEPSLEKEHELKHKALGELANAKLRTDLTPLLEGQNATNMALQDTNARLVAFAEEAELRHGAALKALHEAVENHERRAQERHDRQILAMEQVTENLGKLANGNGKGK
jgi:hypothetical protein